MGRVLLVARLAARNLRRRPVEAVLLVLAIMAATTTLTLGLVLQGVTDHPYQTTREATTGPDVVASVGPDPVGDPTPNGSGRSRVSAVPADPADLEALFDAPGVVGHSGPYPVVLTNLDADGATAGVWVQGRDAAEVSVDQPALTEGGWVEDGGAVVEGSFADALGVGAGDQITLHGRSFRVAGVAVTAATRPYPDVCFEFCPKFIDIPLDYNPFVRGPDEPLPNGPLVTIDLPPPPPSEPGLVWLTRADVHALVAAEESLSYVVNLKLADPSEAQAFAEARIPTTRAAPFFLDSWQGIRDGHRQVVEDQQLVLQTASSLLALLAVASVAVLFVGRMADQTRRVGLLKAVGATPCLVAVVLLAEYMVVALLAAAAGLAAGWLAAPLLTNPGAGLLGSAGAPSLTISTFGFVSAVALGVAVAATLVPSVRAARTSTVSALADSARPPRRTAWLIAISARLPTAVLLGLRISARRPRRVVLNAVSIAITVSGIVAALAVRATNATDWDSPGLTDPDGDRLDRLLLVITVTLVALAAVNAIFITWATALDTKRTSALARALGATPHQVSTGLSTAQVLPALAGAVLGIFGGLALHAALSNDEAARPPLWQLFAVVAGTVLIVAALTSLPARLGARRPTAEILQSELA